MRILITGGAGFIGSHIADLALARGHEVLVIDDLSTGRRENVPAAAELVVLDLRRADDVRAVFERFRPDAVTHQAAQASVAISMREPVRDADVNVPARDLGIPQRFLDHGTRAQTLADIGLTAQDVARKVVETMARLDGGDLVETGHDQADERADDPADRKG